MAHTRTVSSLSNPGFFFPYVKQPTPPFCGRNILAVTGSEGFMQMGWLFMLEDCVPGPSCHDWVIRRLIGGFGVRGCAKGLCRRPLSPVFMPVCCFGCCFLVSMEVQMTGMGPSTLASLRSSVKRKALVLNGGSDRVLCPVASGKSVPFLRPGSALQVSVAVGMQLS